MSAAEASKMNALCVCWPKLMKVSVLVLDLRAENGLVFTICRYTTKRKEKRKHIWLRKLHKYKLSSPSISTTLPFLHYHLISFFILPLSLLLYFPLPFLSLPFSLPTSLPPFTLWSPLPTLLHSLSPPSLPPSILTQQHVPVSLVRDGIDMGWYLMTFLASVELNNIRSVDGVQPVGVDHDTEQAWVGLCVCAKVWICMLPRKLKCSCNETMCGARYRQHDWTAPNSIEQHRTALNSNKQHWTSPNSTEQH